MWATLKANMAIEVLAEAKRRRVLLPNFKSQTRVRMFSSRHSKTDLIKKYLHSELGCSGMPVAEYEEQTRTGSSCPSANLCTSKNEQKKKNRS